MRIPLTKGQWATIDEEDASTVLRHSWYAREQRPGLWYAFSSTGKGNTIRLHNFLMPDAKFIDHRNGDGLDNRRDNLRPSTIAQNARNSKIRKQNKSGFKGVYQIRPGRWRAQITHNYINIFLGDYGTPEEAHRAYITKARELFGEFARAS